MATLCALPPLAASTQEQSAGPSDSEEGRLLYRVHCLGCHGESGRGDGPIREQLATPPADLTTISQRKGGRFPAEEVTESIDGRRESPSHGGREMPVWGFSFQPTGREGDQEEEVRGRIRALVRYLESIQEDDGPREPAQPSNG